MSRAVCIPDVRHITSGSLSLLLTRSPEAVKEAQKLRHRIFFQEANGVEPENIDDSSIDHDRFDNLCDHLLVLDHARTPGKVEVVGTYRFLHYPARQAVDAFYTQTEFDISRLTSGDHRLMELGRSCIHPDYRNGTVIQLLWRGIGAYVIHHQISYLFGCASMNGINLHEHQLPLSYLYHYHRAPDDICPSPLPHVKANIDMLPKESFDKREAFAMLPPLMKGYLRVGAMISNGAVIDEVCQTTDVCVIVDTTRMSARYSKHFVESASNIEQYSQADKRILSEDAISYLTAAR